MTKKEISKIRTRAAKIGMEKLKKTLSPREYREHFIALQAKRKVRRGRFSKPLVDNSTDTPKKVSKIKGF